MYVTHDQEEALAVSDRVAVMRAGKIEQIGPPEELYGAPATRFVAEFIGTMNRIESTVAAPGTVDVGGVRLAVDAAAIASRAPRCCCSYDPSRSTSA